MALLDIQAMDSARGDTRWCGGGGGEGGGSHLSLALCDSTVSLTVCL
jgi:Lanthionine-containing peptide SapB precursor RamS